MNEIIKARVIQAATLILHQKSNVRQVAKYLGYSKSTIHKDLSQRLLEVDQLLYIEVQKLFTINKNEKHLRGGAMTKKKYLKN